MQLGTLYPFSRNHNAIGERSQEPYAFGESLLNISIDSLNRRYTLLPYYYTLFASAHFNATTVWRPLFFEFSNDTNTFGIDTQFMVGPALLVTPVLEENATTVAGYFPSGIWYSYYTGIPLFGKDRMVTLDAPLDFIPIHVRAGYIIPTQQPALTTTAARTNPYGLLVALDANGHAQGELYIDEGESLELVYNQIAFYASPLGGGGAITGNVLVHDYFNSTIPSLGNVTVFGVGSAPHKVVANNAAVPFAYNATSETLTIWKLSLDIVSNFDILWA